MDLVFCISDGFEIDVLSTERLDDFRPWDARTDSKLNLLHRKQIDYEEDDDEAPEPEPVPFEVALLRNVNSISRDALDALVVQLVVESQTVNAEDITTLLGCSRRRSIGELPTEVSCGLEISSLPDRTADSSVDQILVDILRFLPMRDRILALRTCRHFRQLAGLGAFDEVRFLKVAVQKAVCGSSLRIVGSSIWPSNAHLISSVNPFAWIKAKTVASFLRSIPTGTVRSLLINHNFISQKDIKSLLKKELTNLTSLTLVGGSFLSRTSCWEDHR